MNIPPRVVLRDSIPSVGSLLALAASKANVVFLVPKKLPQIDLDRIEAARLKRERKQNRK
jgi:hypothetical protein